MNVKVFSTPTCPYCTMVKEYLEKNKVQFEAIDVAEDEKAAKEMVEKSGQMGVPVTMVDEKVIIGFNEEELKQALNLS